MNELVLTPEERQQILDQREERRKLDRQLAIERRRHDAEHAYLEGDIWKTADGRKIPVAEMTPLHALRSIRIATSMWNMHNTHWSGQFSDQVDMRNKPRLITLLEARAKDKPTLRDKFKDRRSALQAASKMAKS